ncbi:MAG: LysR family transcriptional regulator [Halomonas sp.]|nr:LysR family transcriptional regulator [Halomonas sp.]TVP51065.1 MAG: LysR family transcriptional regulator [Halomonas sp.]
MQIAMFKYFLAVAETGSIRQASLALHVSASAISRQIQNLEHSFQTTLFDRSSDGMLLTEEGRILALHMQRTMREMELARAKIDDIHGLTAGTVRYATIEGVVRAWLFPAIADFQRTYPLVEFKGRISGAEAVYQALENDEVDFGITMYDDLYPDIGIVEKFTTPFQAAMPLQHPLAQRKTLHLEELLPYELTMLDSTFHTRRALDKSLLRMGLNVRIGFELDHIELIKVHVLQTGNITILPDYAVIHEKQHQKMAIVDIEEDEIPFATTILCVRRGRRLTRAAEEIIKKLRLRPITLPL